MTGETTDLAWVTVEGDSGRNEDRRACNDQRCAPARGLLCRCHEARECKRGTHDDPRLLRKGCHTGPNRSLADVASCPRKEGECGGSEKGKLEVDESCLGQNQWKEQDG